jgi:hypothetical protein
MSGRVELGQRQLGPHMTAAMVPRNKYVWDALTKIALTLASGCYAWGHRMMPELVQ